MDITNAYLSRRPLQMFGELWHRLPLPSSNRFRKAQAQLDGIVYRFIAERRARGVSGAQGDDLLSMLLAAQDVEGDGTGMTDQQLHDECTTLFAAGHETTAITLMWTWYALSQHPDVEAQLHAELASVLHGRMPTLEDIPNLKYTQMVLSEVLRLYPPAWALGRVNTEDYEVGGYVVPARSVVSLMPFVTHRDPRWYPEPERFDPQRWTPDEAAKRPKFSYYPFGAGPRQCIGESFAWMEATLLLATIAQQWRMKLAPNHPVALEPLITLHAKYGMKMVLEKVI
jgi:cytochrome P450